MIGPVTSGSVNTALNFAYQATETLGLSSVISANGSDQTTGTTGVTTNTSGDQAQISPAGQLFGQLQQLQSQDPAKYTQLLSNVANQLTTAAQQTTGPQSQALTDLASLLQSAANTSGSAPNNSGNAAAPPPHHHGHHGQGIYNQLGQVTPTSASTTSNTTSDTSSTGLNLQQLFANITADVTQALGG